MTNWSQFLSLTRTLHHIYHKCMYVQCPYLPLGQAHRLECWHATSAQSSSEKWTAAHISINQMVCVCVSVSIWAQRGKQAMRTSRQTRERASEPKIKGAAHPNVTLYVNQTSIAGISNYWWEEKRQNDVVCLWPVQQPRQASWGLLSPCNKQFTQLKTWCHTHTHKSVARTWHTG